MIAEEDSHRAFRALLEAFARPGMWMATPGDGPEQTVELLRNAAWQDDPNVAVTNASRAAVDLARADPGTEEEPELSTTLVVLADDDVVTTVSIDGPGVRDRMGLQLPLDGDTIAARNKLCSEYPRGVDVVVVDSAGRLLGLPRTTRVETAS